MHETAGSNQSSKSYALYGQHLDHLLPALLGALTIDDVASVIMTYGVPALNANLAILYLLSDDSHTLHAIRSSGVALDTLDAWKVIPCSIPTPASDAVHTLQPVILETEEDWSVCYPQYARERKSFSAGAVCLPLIASEHVVGVISLGFPPRRTFDKQDHSIMTSLAEKWAIALARARAYDAEHMRRKSAEKEANDHQSELEETHRVIADLRQRLRGLETLFNVVPVGLYVSDDPECRLIKANPAGARLLNMPPGANVSRSPLNPETPAFTIERNGSDLPPNEMPLEIAISTGQEVRDQALDVVWPNGARHHVLGFAAPIRDDQGEIRGGIAAYTNITARLEFEAALRESEERFKTAFDFAPIGKALVGLDGRFLRVNRVMCDLVGYSPEELLASDFQTITHPDDLTADLEYIDQLTRGVIRQYEMEKRYIHKTGRHVLAQLSVSLVHNTSGEPIHFISQIQDITARKEVEAELIAQAAKLEEAQKVARIGNWEIETATRKMTWSDEIFRLLEFDPQDSEPSWNDLIARLHPDDIPLLPEAAMITGQFYEQDLRMIRNDGSIMWVHIIGHGEVDNSGTVVRLFGTIMDVTERRQAQETIKDYSIALQEKMIELEQMNAELEILATSDGLTGLLNHRALQERLAAEYAGARRYDKPLSLLMLDVDNFKLYNDTFGHPEGDVVLRKVARILKSSARPMDAVARYGGEEFAVILPHTDGAGAMAAAERIRASVETGHWTDRSITISVGVTTLGADNEDYKQLLIDADRALYASKVSGRNKVTHAEEI